MAFLRSSLWLATAVLAFAQNSARFEVVSVKPALNPNREHSGVYTGHGRLSATNITLKNCVMRAYHVGQTQIAGGPDWLDTATFDIEARAATAIEDDNALTAMLQPLLADRFKLVLHHESRSTEAYVLEVAKNGPRLSRTEPGEANTNSRRGSIQAQHSSMDHLAEVLGRFLDRPILNRTELDGVYNLNLQWTPDTSPADTPDRVSIFTAVQEQLGLRLRAEKIVDTLVIDRAERPEPN